MDLRNLRCFLAIAEAPSLSAAAQMLGVAQPSLSQRVQKMEHELGVILLERSPRGIRLTEEGRLLHEHARRICADLDRCAEDLRELSETVRGTVALGVPPSASMVLSVPLAETVRHDFPELRLKVIEAISGYLTPWLDEGVVDMAVVYDLKDSGRYRAVHMLEEELYFYTAPDAWPFDGPPGRPVAFAELAQVELILPTSGLRDTIRRYERENGVALNVVIEMDAMAQIIELVARGSGHTIFAPPATHRQVARGELIGARIIDPVLTRPVHLIHHPDRVSTRAARKVEELILSITRELVQRGIWDARIV